MRLAVGAIDTEWSDVKVPGCMDVQYLWRQNLGACSNVLHGKIWMIDSVRDDEVIQNDLKELIRLVRLDEQYLAVTAYGIFLQLDQISDLTHQYRVNRIDELSRKYGIQ